MRGSDTGRVFISYRRAETAWPARQLYEVLCEQFGADQVFKDIDDIEPGDDFVDKIAGAVSSCDVLLALIGERWLTITDEEGRRRLDDPDDFVRLEIGTALRRPDVRVIPILVDAARMPRAQELPPDLEPLVRRQAVQLDAVSFDATRLMRAVQETLADLHGEGAAPSPQADGRTTRVQDVGDGTGSRVTEVERADLVPRRRTVLFSTLAAVGVLSSVLVVYQLGSHRAPPGSEATGARSGSNAASQRPSGSAGASRASVDGPDVLAHRGGWEQFAPESFEAITSAARKGYAAETDVRWTSDDVPVLVHDDTGIRLACTRPVEVSRTTWNELRTLCQNRNPRDGKLAPIATYVGVMEALGAIDDAWAYVEVKVDQTPQQTRKFLQVIADNGMTDRTVVTSFDPNYLRAIHTAAPKVRLMRFTTKQIPVSELENEHLWAVAVKSESATKTYVRDVRHAGVIVVDWPLDDPSEWAAGRAVGADKVLTDNPDGYSAWLARH